MKKSFLFFCIAFFWLNASAVPTVLDFNINNDQTYATSEDANLMTYSLDANKMNFSCDNNIFGAWVDYSPIASFNLKTGPGCTGLDGTITVYVKLWNLDSNTFETGQDSILMDTKKPDLNWVYIDANTLNPYSALNKDKNLLVRVASEKNLASAKFSVGDINNLDLFDDGAHDDSQPNDGIYAGKLDIKKTNRETNGYVYVTVTLKDSAGNTSTGQSFTTVSIDLNKPSSNGKVPLEYTNSRKPEVKLNLLDPNSGIDKNSVTLTINGTDYNFEKLSFSDINNGLMVSFTPDGNISGQQIDVNIFFSDKADNNADTNWSIKFDFNAPNPVIDINALTVSNTNDVNVLWQSVEDQLSGITKYELYRYTEKITTSNISSAVIVSSSISPKTGLNYFLDDLNSSMEDVNLFYAVRAVDGAGNLSFITVSPSVIVNDVTPPEDANFFVETDVNSETPKITFSGNDISETYFSCNGSDFNGPFKSSPVTSFKITDENFGCDSTDGNRVIYMKAVDNADNNVTVSHSVLLDRTAPGTPSGLQTEIRDSGILVSWNAVTDEISGLDYYKLYISPNNNVSTKSYFVKVSDKTSYLYKSPAKINYFAVSAVDKAENESLLSETVKEGLDKNTPELKILFPNAVKIREQIFLNKTKIRIEVESDKKLVWIKGKIVHDENTVQDLNFELGEDENNYFFEGELEKEFDGNRIVDINVLDEYDINASKKAVFVLDKTPPEILFFDLNVLSPEQTLVSVEFSEDTNSIALKYFDGNEFKKIFEQENVTAVLPENKLVFDWNTALIKEGYLSVRVEAKDFLGNTVFKDKNIVIKGKKLPVSIELEDLKEKEKEMDKTKKELKHFGFGLGESEYYYKNFKANLEKAEKFLREEKKEAREAVEKARFMAKFFELSVPKISIEREVTLSLSQNKEKLKEEIKRVMSGSGLETALKLNDKIEFKRKALLLKIEEQGEKRYYPVFETIIKNKSNLLLTNTFLVQEIPKELFESVSDFSSNTVFITLKEDPLIAVFIPEIRVNGSASIVLKTRKEMSFKKAREMIERKNLELMETPVLLEKEEQLFDYKKQGIGIIELFLFSLAVLLVVGIISFVKSVRGKQNAENI